MPVGLALNKDSMFYTHQIYYKVVGAEEKKNVGLINELIGELTSVPGGSEWLLSYEADVRTPIGTVRSFGGKMVGGEFEFAEMAKNKITVDNFEVSRLFGWVYLVGGRWLPK